MKLVWYFKGRNFYDIRRKFFMEMHEKIKYLRAKRGMTLEEVGNIVGVGKSTVRKWESGDIANMRRDKIAKLSEALGCTPAYLMGWEENEQTKPTIKPTETTKLVYKALTGKDYIEDEVLQHLSQSYVRESSFTYGGFSDNNYQQLSVKEKIKLHISALDDNDDTLLFVLQYLSMTGEDKRKLIQFADIAGLKPVENVAETLSDAIKSRYEERWMSKQNNNK